MGVRVWILLTVVMGALLGSCSTEKISGSGLRRFHPVPVRYNGSGLRRFHPVPVRYNGLVRARAAQRSAHRRHQSQVGGHADRGTDRLLLPGPEPVDVEQ